MPSAEILDKLHNETLDHIFSFLSGSQWHISACRQTCRIFHLLSSPYLLPSIVIASRLQTLHKSHQICQHPYFSRHVTQMVFVDDRWYDYELYDHAVEVASCGK